MADEGSLWGQCRLPADLAPGSLHLTAVQRSGNRAPGPHTDGDGPSAIPGLGIPGAICGLRVAWGEDRSSGQDALRMNCPELPVLPSTSLTSFCIVFK